ncbi:methyl-accepting chemotaxis protein [Paenibacillus xylaniclasticus]|uniref:methyl-accepting chemotaxis protein n=1 Tax=Paenibacillus xylaniclasticus TaxID=588083 RepID=UPI000FD8ECC9|nr:MULTISPECIES: methyl-accepting chemotaxis protein [Paenibacillus]GFN33565.1 methyl-accepting chemotaxis protein [Paenibacillus curdlanolyticus]
MVKKVKKPKTSGNKGLQQETQDTLQTEQKTSKSLNNKFSIPRVKLNGSWKNVKWVNPRYSVGAKLFLIILSSILVCVLVVGLLAYNTSRGIIRDNAMDSSYQTIQQAAGKLNLMFNNYVTQTLQVMVDPDIQELISAVRDEQYEKHEKFQTLTKIQTVLDKYALSDDSIAKAYFFPIDDREFALGASTINKETLESFDWYKNALAVNGQAVWVPTSVSGPTGKSKESTFGIARVLKNNTTTESMFVLLFEIKEDILVNAVGDISLGDGSTITIVDEQNRYVMYPGDSTHEKLAQPSDINLPTEGDQVEVGSLETKDGSGHNVLAAYSTLNSAGWKIVGKVPVEQLIKDAKQIYVQTLIVTIIAALVAVAISYVLIRTFAHPLVKLRNLMNEGERGNLSVRLKLNRKDEIGQLTDSFNRMMAEITSLVEQTNLSANDVLATASELTEASRKTAVSAKEIAVATEEIAGGATSLATEAERGNDLTMEINEQMKSVLSSNRSMEQSAAAVEQASEQGSNYMNVLIEKTGVTEEMTRNMVSKVDKLKDSTSSIRKILDVLNNLTKQTNILSLNATIEAARAGAAGKGFMVVADEIRKLADQSRHSIDVVGQITETIQREIDETVGVLTEAYPIFQEQVSSVKESNQIFLTVQGHMSSFAESLASVTEAIGKLDGSQAVLTEAMSSVSAVAEQSSATSQEVASLSNEQLSISEGLVKLSSKLEEVSNKLQQSLARFTTTGTSDNK